MSILTILAVLIAVGLVLWLINEFIPMDAQVKKILNVFVIIVLVIWLVKASGLLGYLGSVRV